MRKEQEPVLRHLVRRAWLVVLFGLLAALAAYTVSRNPPTVYRSTLTFVLQPAPDLETGEIPDAVRGIAQESGHLRNTVAAIVGTRAFLDRAGLESVGRELVPEYGIVASVNPDTDILVLSLEGPDRGVLQRVGPTLAEQAAGWVESVYRVYRLTLFDTVTPGDPLPAQTGRNIALAGVLGILLGFGLAYAERHMRLGIGAPTERRRGQAVEGEDDDDDDDLLPSSQRDMPDTTGRAGRNRMTPPPTSLSRVRDTETRNER